MNHDELKSAMQAAFSAKTTVRIPLMESVVEISKADIVPAGLSKGAMRNDYALTIAGAGTEGPHVTSWIEGRKNTATGQIEQNGESVLYAGIDGIDGSVTNDWIFKSRTQLIINPAYASVFSGEDQLLHDAMMVDVAAKARFLGSISDGAGNPAVNGPSVDGIKRYNGLGRLLDVSFYIPAWAFLVARVKTWKRV